MANHLTQLLVAALEIKGCTIFALNVELDELEVLASFGLSTDYVHKGPVLSDKSIADTFGGKPFVIRDVKNTDKLQYPQDAEKEGIGTHQFFGQSYRRPEALSPRGVGYIGSGPRLAIGAVREYRIGHDLYPGA